MTTDTRNVGDIVISANEKILNGMGTEQYELIIANGATVSNEESYRYGDGLKTGDNASIPDMDSGSELLPYRILAELKTPAIGELRDSAKDKYITYTPEGNEELFDQRIADGSNVSYLSHPLLWEEKAQGKIMNTNHNFADGLTGWTIEGGTVEITEGGVKLAGEEDDVAYLTQAVTTVIGETYYIAGLIYPIADPIPRTMSFSGIRKTDTVPVVTNSINYLISTDGFFSESFVATATTTYIMLQCNWDVYDDTRREIIVGMAAILNAPVVHEDLTSDNSFYPTREVSDLRTPILGEIRNTDLERYSENGVDLFSYVLLDGSRYDEDLYPNLAVTLRDVVPFIRTPRFENNAEGWVLNQGAMEVTDNGLLITADNATAKHGFVSYEFKTEIDETYIMKIKVAEINNPNGGFQAMRKSDASVVNGEGDNYIDYVITETGEGEIEFVATATLTYVVLQCNFDANESTGTQTMTIEEVTVIEKPYLPLVTAPNTKYPARMIADLVLPALGDIRKSALDYYIVNGEPYYKQVLSDETYIRFRQTEVMQLDTLEDSYTERVFYAYHYGTGITTPLDLESDFFKYTYDDFSDGILTVPKSDTGGVTITDTVIQFEDLGFPFYLYAYNGYSTSVPYDDVSQGEIIFYTADDTVLLKIKVTTETAGLTLHVDTGNGYVTMPNTGSIDNGMRGAGIIDYDTDSQTLSWEHRIESKGYTYDFEEVVDLTGLSHVVVGAFAKTKSTSSTASACFSLTRRGKKTPLNTSTDADHPDRVVLKIM